MKQIILIAPLLLTGCLKIDTLEMEGVGQWIGVRDNDIEGPNALAFYFRKEVGHDLHGYVIYSDPIPVTNALAGPGIGPALAGAAGQIFRNTTRNADDINNTTIVQGTSGAAANSSQEVEVDD
jgi:hypothetical protein